MESGLTREKIFSELTKSPHGKLDEYLPIGVKAEKEGPEFFARLIAWNAKHGEIRDSKVALPLISVAALAGSSPGNELLDNALAHLAMLAPRDLLRGLRFAKDQKLNGRRQILTRLVGLYLKSLESNRAKWERVAVQHRRTLTELYTLYHVKPAPFAEEIIFQKRYEVGSIFEAIKNLKLLSPVDAASTVISRRIPFLIAAPALGEKLRSKEVLLALIGSMSPGELTLHMKMLEKLGVRKDPTLRGALEQALATLVKGRSSALKISKAMEVLDDEDMKARLQTIQEEKLDKVAIEGNWLVLADKSTSMYTSLELSRSIAALLARSAKGSVHLTFFNEAAEHYEVTGNSLEEIREKTKFIRANGNTSIGVGIAHASARGWSVDGIAIVSDGGENTAPSFTGAYLEYCQKFGKKIPVYLYRVAGDRNVMEINCQRHDVAITQFDMAANVDYYSLPALVKTMRTNRFSLMDEVMETPLLTLSQVLKLKEGVRV